MNANEALTKELWYKKPAESWQEALPIGNGRLGVMVYGNPNRDLLALNEDSLWGGHPLDRRNPLALESLPKIQKLIFEGKLKEAGALAEETMIARPKRVAPYEPLGDLIIEQWKSKDYREYRRSLSLNTAMAYVDYRMGEANYHKEYFSSYPDQVLAVRYTCEQPEGFTLTVRLNRTERATSTWADENTILMEGYGDEKGIHFAAALRVIPEGSQMEQYKWQEGQAALEVHNADAVTFYLAAETTFRKENPSEEVLHTLDAAEQKGYEALKQAHIEDYRALFDRFDFDIFEKEESEKEEKEKLTKDSVQRLEQFQNGGEDVHIFSLYTSYQRYLLLASSRRGCLPSNLQGIWNDRMLAPWESDFHTNINYQVNYWPAEAYNLTECHEPVFEYIKILEKSGRETAKKTYGANGWVVHHCTDIWGASEPIAWLLGLWPMGALWCCRDIYEYYAYTGDEEFLRKNYPILRGAVEFVLDFLVEVPKGNPWEGYLVTNPSHSPENQFLTDEGTAEWLTYAATMDLEIIRDLCDICVKLIEHLAEKEGGFDEEFKERILQTEKRLPPLQISKKTGGIQEWLHDFDEVELGHRHVSHLYACYPSSQIDVEKTPELAAAAKKTIWRRYKNHYDTAAWNMGWVSCIWARLREAEEAYHAVSTVLRKHTLYNLFVDSHGRPQVGDAQAATSGMLEMLAQSHDEKIQLLPALPKDWANGFVRGMKLRGGYELDMEWKHGRLEKAELRVEDWAKEWPIVWKEMEDYSVCRRQDCIEIRRK